ncbi:chitinase [Mycobacterium sp. IS-1496]|uniref:chitinase n=1 Tax=Mycobacterium sp. IS-1496 TaxID=1772284 RepID=UPI0009E7F0AF|nr:chitinase [Mycobacterium sp. IS-1496]
MRYLRTAACLAVAAVVGCGAHSMPASPHADADPSFVVSREDFDAAFPGRIPFYTYENLIEALPSFPGFATTGDDTVRRREAAAFFGNVAHETGGLEIIEEAPHRRRIYCDPDLPFGCPAGEDAYFGRGPGQLSWNYNYRAAGEALGADLLTDPDRVGRDAVLAWRTALWFWNTQKAAAEATPHDAMVGGLGFGQTIRAFNGVLECDGGNPAQVRSRVDAYLRICALLGVPPGENLYC